jgi:hypothetical protein
MLLRYFQYFKSCPAVFKPITWSCIGRFDLDSTQGPRTVQSLLATRNWMKHNASVCRGPWMPSTQSYCFFPRIARPSATFSFLYPLYSRCMDHGFSWTHHIFHLQAPSPKFHHLRPSSCLLRAETVIYLRPCGVCMAAVCSYISHEMGLLGITLEDLVSYTIPHILVMCWDRCSHCEPPLSYLLQWR